MIQEQSYGEVQTIGADEFVRRLTDLTAWYPPEIVQAQMNLLDSHDTARFVTIAHGDVTALRLALLTMFCYAGAPTIYYGDEMAMAGARDPDCRRAMNWDPNTDGRAMIAYVKRLSALRKNYVALRRGTMTSLYANGKVFAFARQAGNETVLVAVNAGREPVTLDLRVDGLLDDGTRVANEWTREEIRVQDGFLRGVGIAPRDGGIWHTANSA